MKYTVKIGDIEYVYEAETAEQIKAMVEAIERDKPHTMTNNYNVYTTDGNATALEITKKLGDVKCRQ